MQLVHEKLLVIISCTNTWASLGGNSCHRNKRVLLTLGGRESLCKYYGRGKSFFLAFLARLRVSPNMFISLLSSHSGPSAPFLEHVTGCKFILCRMHCIAQRSYIALYCLGHAFLYP